MADQPALPPHLAAPDGLPLPQRTWAILTIALGLTLAVLDGAIANVALPTIAHDLDASPASSIWVVNAYQLAVTISLLPLASLGDIYGYRRVYQYGLIVFTIASLGCALSDSLLTLTIARVVQGFGAAGIMSVNGALVRFIYPRRWLGRGVGLNATIGSIASAVGPTVAAGILSVAPWPWLFAVNVPIGAVAIPMALRTLPQTRRLRRAVRCAERDLERAHLRHPGQRDQRTGPRRERQPRRRRTVHRAGVRLRAGDAATVADARRCCRSICCGFRCSRCRSPPRSARSSRRAWRWCRCRSCSRTRWAAARWRRDCC